MDNIGLYIQIFVTALCAIAYIYTFKYQAIKMNILESSVKSLNDQICSQSKIIADFEKYKSLFDIDDFEKRLKLKLDTQKDELSFFYKSELEKIGAANGDRVFEMMKSESDHIIKCYAEFQRITANSIIKQFPQTANKALRDRYIMSNYPINHQQLIIDCDRLSLSDSQAL